MDGQGVRTHAENVNTPSENVDVNLRSGDEAGPFATAPSVVYFELWQGQTKRRPLYSVTVQPSCVHTAVSTVKAVWAVRATRKSPREVSTVATLPTALKAPAESIGTETVRPGTDAPIEVTDWLLEGVREGAAGLSPHPGYEHPNSHERCSLAGMRAELPPRLDGKRD